MRLADQHKQILAKAMLGRGYSIFPGTTPACAGQYLSIGIARIEKMTKTREILASQNFALDKQQQDELSFLMSECGKKLYKKMRFSFWSANNELEPWKKR